MTEAEKAFEKLQAGEWVDDEGIEAIRKALQGVDNTWLDKKAAMADAAMVCKLTDENKALKAKSQILLRALEEARTDAAIDHDHLPPTQVMGNLLGFIEDTATKAITAFNSDETGVGL